MPHYKDGKPAKLGDLVKGRGYNLKGVVEGYVLAIKPEQDACNISIGTTHVDFDADPNLPGSMHPVGQPAGRVEYVTVEYGQADAFEKLED